MEIDIYDVFELFETQLVQNCVLNILYCNCTLFTTTCVGQPMRGCSVSSFARNKK